MRASLFRQLSPLPVDYPKMWLAAHLSLTRFVIDHLKAGKDSHDTGWLLRRWNWFWFVAEFGVALSWCLLGATNAAWPKGFAALFCIVALWRVNEITYAFYSDGLSKLRGEAPASNIQNFERVGMLLRSSFGAAVQFAVLYFFLIPDGFKVPFQDFRDALYFSAATMTSIGQEGQEVQSQLLRLVHIYQAALGVLLFVIALSIYLGEQGKRAAA